MHPEKIFITGATGYIGHQLALTAVQKGYGVHALVRNPASPLCPQQEGIQLFEGDITDPASVSAAMQGCQYVLHAAALAQMWNRDRALFYRVNVEGTRNVLEAALQWEVKKVVFTSSCAVLGAARQRPVQADEPRTTGFDNDYDISKHCAEELVRLYHRRGLPAVIVRPSRVYGPGLATQANPINKLMQEVIRSGAAFMPATNKAMGNYAFIDDVVHGHFRALSDGISGQSYNLGGENITYRQFFNAIRHHSGKNIKLIPVPKALLQAWAGCVFAGHYLLGRHTHMSPKVIERLFQNRAVCCQKSVAQLGYNITPFQQGVQQTIQHLKEKQNV